MTTAIPATPPPQLVLAEADNEVESVIAGLSGVANHIPPAPNVADAQQVPSEPHYATPNVYQAAYAPEFRAGAQQPGRVELRMKISRMA